MKLSNRLLNVQVYAVMFALCLYGNINSQQNEKDNTISWINDQLLTKLISDSIKQANVVPIISPISSSRHTFLKLDTLNGQGDIPENASIVIKGESTLRLFHQTDIDHPSFDPSSFLDLATNDTLQPVEVNPVMGQPYFMFLPPTLLKNTTIENILSSHVDRKRVKRHHPSVVQNVIGELQNYALVPVKSQNGQIRYILLKNPKFVIGNPGSKEGQPAPAIIQLNGSLPSAFANGQIKFIPSSPAAQNTPSTSRKITSNRAATLNVPAATPIDSMFGSQSSVSSSSNSSVKESKSSKRTMSSTEMVNEAVMAAFPSLFESAPVSRQKLNPANTINFGNLEITPAVSEGSVLIPSSAIEGGSAAVFSPTSSNAVLAKTTDQNAFLNAIYPLPSTNPLTGTVANGLVQGTGSAQSFNRLTPNQQLSDMNRNTPASPGTDINYVPSALLPERWNTPIVNTNSVSNSKGQHMFNNQAGIDSLMQMFPSPNGLTGTTAEQNASLNEMYPLSSTNPLTGTVASDVIQGTGNAQLFNQLTSNQQFNDINRNTPSLRSADITNVPNALLPDFWSTPLEQTNRMSNSQGQNMLNNQAGIDSIMQMYPSPNGLTGTTHSGNFVNNNPDPSSFQLMSADLGLPFFPTNEPNSLLQNTMSPISIQDPIGVSPTQTGIQSAIPAVTVTGKVPIFPASQINSEISAQPSSAITQNEIYNTQSLSDAHNSLNTVPQGNMFNTPFTNTILDTQMANAIQVDPYRSVSSGTPGQDTFYNILQGGNTQQDPTYPYNTQHPFSSQDVPFGAATDTNTNPPATASHNNAFNNNFQSNLYRNPAGTGFQEAAYTLVDPNNAPLAVSPTLQADIHSNQAGNVFQDVRYSQLTADPSGLLKNIPSTWVTLREGLGKETHKPNIITPIISKSDIIKQQSKSSKLVTDNHVSNANNEKETNKGTQSASASSAITKTEGNASFVDYTNSTNVSITQIGNQQKIEQTQIVETVVDIDKNATINTTDKASSKVVAEPNGKVFMHGGIPVPGDTASASAGAAETAKEEKSAQVVKKTKKTTTILLTPGSKTATGKAEISEIQHTVEELLQSNTSESAAAEKAAKANVEVKSTDVAHSHDGLHIHSHAVPHTHVHVHSHDPIHSHSHSLAATPDHVHQIQDATAEGKKEANSASTSVKTKSVKQTLISKNGSDQGSTSGNTFQDASGLTAGLHTGGDVAHSNGGMKIQHAEHVVEETEHKTHDASQSSNHKSSSIFDQHHH